MKTTQYKNRRSANEALWQSVTYLPKGGYVTHDKCISCFSNLPCLLSNRQVQQFPVLRKDPGTTQKGYYCTIRPHLFKEASKQIVNYLILYCQKACGFSSVVAISGGSRPWALRGVGGGGDGGFDLLALSAIFPSVISSFFTQNKGGGWGG